MFFATLIRKAAERSRLVGLPASLAFALVLWTAGGAEATAIVFKAHLDGLSAFPVNASPGTGDAYVLMDDIAHELRIVVVPFENLVGSTVGAHIHCCTGVPSDGVAPVATETPSLQGFPLGVTTGNFDRTFSTLSSTTWNPAFVTASGGTPADAEAALRSGLLEGKAYFDIHTSFRPGGEIRGFFAPFEFGPLPDPDPVPGAVPEPATLLMTLAGLGGFARSRRRGTRS
jgi:hypothetical protein